MLNPLIQEILDIATDGLDLMEAARVRTTILQRLQDASLCNMISPITVFEIAIDVLDEDIAAIKARLEEIRR